MDDPFDLVRFLKAQAAVYPQVIGELESGQKQSHWMWFIFPQMKGLGSSPYATYFGIGSIEEAKDYLDHPVLGPRLEQCTILVNQIKGRTIGRIFNAPDDLKFRSSMTLFAQAATDPAVFSYALDKYFGGRPDPVTLELLG